MASIDKTNKQSTDPQNSESVKQAIEDMQQSRVYSNIERKSQPKLSKGSRPKLPSRNYSTGKEKKPSFPVEAGEVDPKHDNNPLEALYFDSKYILTQNLRFIETFIDLCDKELPNSLNQLMKDLKSYPGFIGNQSDARYNKTHHVMKKRSSSFFRSSLS